MFWGMGGGGGGKVGAFSRLGAQKLFFRGWGGRLFEAGRLLTFPT